MKNYAEINKDNLVERVLVVSDEKDEIWLNETLGGTWIETSDTIRKNPAGIGYTYDSELDAFIPPKPFDSWTLDKKTAQWKAPVAYPTDGQDYRWDEETVNWVEVPAAEQE